jgi:hypothetical protein
MPDFIGLAAQRYELANTPDLWQLDLMSPQQFWRFAEDHNISVSNGDTVINLWRVGLLRADLVRTNSKLQIPFLELISENNGLFAYCDNRNVQHRLQGYGSSIETAELIIDGVELLFHPFRLYVLYHINRVFRSSNPSTQFLYSSEKLLNIAQINIDQLNTWTSTEQCASRFDHWNKTAELAIILEPTSYKKIFNELRWKFPDTKKIINSKLQERFNTVRDFLSKMSIKVLNDIRGELCQTAEILDRNKLLHVLLRLMSSHERLKLRSSIGASMQFLCMAEIIRRAAEDACGEKLPEEDEMGFGHWMPGARKSIYGCERIFDSSSRSQGDLLTSMGLFSGVKVRCYVEGETELGAFKSAVGEASGTEFINLHGQVIESRRKGLNFIASLENDMKSQIFSVVVLDGDSYDNVRALRKAARDKKFFGRFFISTPDFEFANFTPNELANVISGLAQQPNSHSLAYEKILSLISKAKSGKQCFEYLKEDVLLEVGKGEKWGEHLMNYALSHKKLPRDHTNAGQTRPIIEVANLLIIARGAGYIRSIDKYNVDPNTGELREKES